MEPELPAEHSAQAFYRDMQSAFAATVTRQRGADLAGALVAQAADSFDGNLAIQMEGQPPVACGKGCATCCTLRVVATPPELLLVARFLRATAPAYARAGVDLQARLREADAATRGLDEAQRVALRRRCPFIVQGACAVYKVRPLACRGHASLSVRACVDAAAGRADEVPFSGPHRLVRSLVQLALQSALRDAGLAWAAGELNAGLVALLDEADERAAQQRWQRGESPWSLAPVDAEAAAEQAHWFDEARRAQPAA